MGRQEILIGTVEAKCKVGNLIHEIGHTLGFFHEHSRPDRDQFVKVNLDLVMQGEYKFVSYSYFSDQM